MSNRLDIAKLKLEKGLLDNKGVPSQDLATGLQGLFSGIDADVQAKREARQKFKEDSASDIRDLRSLRAEAEAAGATDDKSSSGQSIKLGDIPTSTTLANWTLTQLDGFIQDSYNKQEVVTSGLGGQFAVRDYNIFKNNQKQTWQAVKGRAKVAGEELEETIRRAEGYTNEEGVFIPPVAGAGEAAFQRYQSIIGDLNNTRVRSGEDGMGIVDVYETVYDTKTGVQKRILDADGNPVINKDISGTSVMSLLNKQNSRWQKTDIIGAVDKTFNKDVMASYEVSTNHPGYIKGSSREDNIRRNPSFTKYQDTFIEKTLPNNRAVSSSLTDNYGGGFYQLDPEQTAKGFVDGKIIDMKETITVNVLTGYDSNGKPIYDVVKAPKYIGSKVEGDGIVVQTTDKHKEAASGILRGAIDGKIGIDIEGGVANAQYDPYRASRTTAKEKEDAGVDLFKQVEKSYGGTDQEVKAATENLMIKSGFKFNETLSDKQKLDRSEDEVILSQTYQVDKGNGVFKSFVVTLMNPNPKYKKDEQAGLKKGDTGYEEQYIPVSKEEYEDKMYELFKGSGDQTSVQKARTNYKAQNSSYRSTGVFNTKGNRDMAVTSTENVDVTEIPEVTANSAIGEGKNAVSAVDFVKNSEGYKGIADNLTFSPDADEVDALANSLDSAFRELAKGQNANQGGDITFVPKGNNIEIRKGNTVIETIAVNVNDEELLQNVETALNSATKTGLPGRAAGTRKKKTVGGNEVFVDAQGVEVDELGVPIKK